MTAYAYLRNVLTNAYRVGFYDVNSNGYMDEVTYDNMHMALTWVEDDVYNRCRTRKDWDTSLHRIEHAIRKAAATASHHDAAFIVNVVRDFYDADYYDVYIDAVEYFTK